MTVHRFPRADLHAFPLGRAGRPVTHPSMRKAGHVRDAAGVNPQIPHLRRGFRREHASGNLLIPVAIFIVTLAVLWKWWV